MIPWLPSALVNHLWQSTLFVLAVWLATLALRSNGARVRYWLWTAASLKFVVPLSALVSLGQRFEWRAAPRAMQPAASFVMQEVLSPAAVVVATPASEPQAVSALSVLPWVLLAVWMLGAGAVLMSWWRQWLPIRSALRHATPVRLDARYDAGDLDVLSSASMPEPGVVGVRRQRLLLPEGALARLTPAQLRALIAHEKHHIRCHDNLVAAIHMVVEAVFWFHPGVWWIGRRLVDERERACDEAVLRSGARPSDYATGILEVCRQSAGLRPACVAGVSGSNLRMRVEAIMRNEIGRPMTRSRRWALAATIAVAIGGPVVGGALTAQSQIVSPAASAFDIASVKAMRRYPGPGPDLTIPVAATPDGRFVTEGSLHSVIQMAYHVTRFQVEGGPSWVRTDRYGVEGQAAGNVAPPRIREMLQSLLADSFKLTLRRETRTLPIYELVEADGGLKIPPMNESGCTFPRDIRWDLIDLEAPLYVCGSFRRRVLSQSPETRPLPRWPRVTRVEAGATSMSAVIDLISTDVDRIVLDRTGFTAPFNLLLDFASSRDAAQSGPTIFDAVEEQLGLQLRPTSAPVDVFVIDRVERPSAN